MSTINEPILITGLPRSGTSLIAGCISLCDTFGGKLVPGNRWNKKGFFENRELREPLVKGILSAHGFCPAGVLSLPPTGYDFSVNGELAIDVKRTLLHQGYDFSKKWFFKDAKLALVWPVWKKAFPDARWVVVYRDKKAVLESCQNTLFMKNQNLNAEQWEEWHKRYSETIFDLSIKTDALVVDCGKLMSGNTESLKSVIHLLGLKYNPEIENFINKDLWHYH